MAENDSLPNPNETNECEEDGIVTMVDVLKAEEILEENADAVLGPGDDKNCTYSQGYLKRQALYSCLTCLPGDGSERAGLCLACSYHCHADHELVELYTKRNFRCDCGNSLFKGRNCTLDQVKSRVNGNNQYNQNFRGVYCTCGRPYPDPEDTEEDEMIQCIVCEDWYHTRHLGSDVPKEDAYAEMICGPCTDKLPFLQHYFGYAVTKVSKSGDESSEVNISTTEANASFSSSRELETSVASDTQNVSVAEDKPETGDQISAQNDTAEESKEKTVTPQKAQDKEQLKENDVSSTTDTEPKGEEEPEGKTDECKLKNLKTGPRGSGATFWPDNFRKLLCVCSSCKEMYTSLGVPYLTDEGDTVRAYEEEGKARKASSGSTQYERGMEALSSLDRVQQMEAILSYNEMKTHLSEYLAKFVENKKVVREEDIREFFTGMQARKRQRLDIPHNCR